VSVPRRNRFPPFCSVCCSVLYIVFICIYVMLIVPRTVYSLVCNSVPGAYSHHSNVMLHDWGSILSLSHAHNTITRVVRMLIHGIVSRFFCMWSIVTNDYSLCVRILYFIVISVKYRCRPKNITNPSFASVVRQRNANRDVIDLRMFNATYINNCDQWGTLVSSILTVSLCNI